MLPKYLVRLNDGMVFELNEEWNLYEVNFYPKMYKPYDHFTYENLTKNYGFVSIKDLVKVYKETKECDNND